MNCANHPDREHVAFCQHCGKAICQECTRTVGTSVFCESCLAERLAGSHAAPSGSYPSGMPEGAIPPPPPLMTPGEPNPGLAALLGIIPGVGAMYNGQFAKGIVHLVIFAILVSLSHENGIFGLFIAGWVIYQIFEAYHTARARRDGTPLPNPFGLNDLGEKLGFGKAWPTSGQPPASASNPAAPPPPGPYTQPPPSGYSPYTAPPANWAAPASAAWNWENYAGPQQPTQPYAQPPFNPVDPNTAYPRNRFPSGAIWLIVLGLIFLIGNSHWMFGFPMHWFVPFLLIGFGVWLFVRKMTEFGAPLADDGTALYRYRLFHALRGSVWIILVGILFLLDSFGILSWGRSWPLFIIVAGLMAVFRGVAYSGGNYPTYIHPQAPPTDATAQSSAPASSIVPPDTHDEKES